MKKMVCLVARQRIIDSKTGKPYTDDNDLKALDGIMYGKPQEISEPFDGSEILNSLINQFERENPYFCADEYELIIGKCNGPML